VSLRVRLRDLHSFSLRLHLLQLALVSLHSSVKNRSLVAFVLGWQVWLSREVLECHSCFQRSTKENGIRSRWRLLSKLVKRQAFSSSVQDAVLGGLGETKGADGHGGDGLNSAVIGDGPNDDENFSVSAFAVGGLGEALHGDGRAVISGHE